MAVPKLRFNEFKDEWKVNRIQDLFYISAGGDIDKENVSKERTDFNNIPIYANSLENNGLYGYTNTYKVSGSTITVTGRGDIGYAIARSESYYPIVRLLVLKPKINLNNVFFANAINNINLILESTGVPQLTAPQISKYFIAYPELKEQEKIANFLSLLDKKIELQRRKIEALKIYKKGLIQKIFNSEYNNCMKIEELILQKSTRNSKNEIREIYSVSNKDGFILQSEHFKDRMVASEDTTNYKIVDKDDFAYNPARINVGSIARMKKEEKGIISPMYICFRCNKKILPEYLEYFFQSPKFIYEMNKRLEGSVRMCLSYESMINIHIELPDKKEQEKISIILNSLDKKVYQEEKRYTRLNEIKKGLLQKMFV